MGKYVCNIPKFLFFKFSIVLQAAPFNGIIVLNVVYSAGGFMQNIKSEYYVVNEQESWNIDF